jgi:predicted GTPase
MLAVNKGDLLPRLDHRELRYLRDRLQSKGLRVLSAHAVCASSGQGVGDLVDAILPALGGRDVFVCGSVNVGKSTLVKAAAPHEPARRAAPRVR